MDKNREIMMKNRHELRTLESMYVNSRIDNLEEVVEEKKNELAAKLIEYKIKVQDGTFEGGNLNPLVVQRYFFKTINPIQSKEPEYNAEKLGIVFDLYSEIITQVNMELGEFLPTISGFCTFAGITTATYKNYRKSSDIDMRVVCEKISDYCFDSNISLAQKGKLSEKSTIYRMKVEQDKSEKAEPQIHIHSNDLDIDLVKSRLKELESFNKTKESSIKVESKERK